jgi:hypothetical protein
MHPDHYGMEAGGTQCTSVLQVCSYFTLDASVFSQDVLKIDIMITQLEIIIDAW